MPQDLRQSDASDRIAGGDEETALTLLYYIRDVFERKRDEASENDSRAERIRYPSKSVHAHSVSSSAARPDERLSKAPSKPHIISPPKTRSATGPSPHANSGQSIHPSCEVKMNRFADKAAPAVRPSSAPHMSSSVNARSLSSSAPCSVPSADPIGSALPTEVRAEIIKWLEAIGVTSASSVVRRREDGSRPAPLEDPWCNGVMLSELAAVLCKNGDRSMVKEVHTFLYINT